MKKKHSKNKKGSLLVGVAIVFLLISSLAAAIISRSTQGALLTTDAKKGYSAYQNSDKNAEAFLDKFKLLDNDGANNKIPENSKVSDFCASIACLDKTGTALSSESKVVDIFNFKASSNLTQGLLRTITAPVPDRIDGILSSGSLTVDKCDGSAKCSGSYNQCDLYVKANDTPAGTIANYEIRRSISKSLSYGAGNFGEDYGWRKIAGGASGGYFDGGSSSAIFKNGTDDFYGSYFGATSGGQYDNTYYFSIKARNKNPFSLDSLYLADGGGDALKSVSIGSASCSGGDALSALGCVVPGANPPGTETLNSAYNCCNGTECFHPSPHWTEDPDEKCALQKCEYDGDEVGINPSGDATSGWCSPLKTNCLKGQSCSQPYRVVGYCINAPSASTQTTYFSSSSWSLSPKVKVYQGPGHEDIIGSRCAYHNCPSDVTSKAKCGGIPSPGGASWSDTSTCSENACGPYNFDINCNLSCSSGYYASNPNADYPQGTCCTKSCSDVSYSNWDDCIDHSCQENICGEWTIRDWAGPMPTCGADPVCECGVQGSCSSDCNGVYDSRSCVPPPTCGPVPVCGMGKSLSGTCTCTCSGCTDTRTCV